MSTLPPSEWPSVDSSAHAPQRRSVVRRAASTLMAEGPGALARMAKHGVGWRYRRAVMASRANDGLLWRLSGGPSSGRSGSITGATPVQAKVSMAAAEAVLQSL